MFDKIFITLFNLLLLVTPLLMAPFTSELFEFNKLIFIYLITLGVTFFWLLKVILDRKIIIKKTAFDIPILLFFSSQILATVFSIDVHTSIFGYYGRFNGGLLSIFCYLILYYGFVTNLSNSYSYKYLVSLFKTTLLSSTLVIIWGLSGKLGIDFSCLLFVGQIGNNCWTDQFRPAERMFSTLGQPNWLGAYLSINFFIAAFLLIKNVLVNKKISLKYILLASYIFINFSAILFTRSRSALFAVCAGIIILLIFIILKYRKSLLTIERRLLLLSFLSLIFALVLFKTGVQGIDRFMSLSTYLPKKMPVEQSDTGQVQSNNRSSVSQPTSEFDVTASSDIRKIVWKGAVKLGLEYPIFGTGVETFAYSYYFARPVEHNLTSEWDYLYNKAHNEYLNYFATTGFFGLVGYLSLTFAVTVFCWKQLKVQTTKDKSELLIVCLFASYVTILITNFFGFSTTTVNLFFFLIPAFLLVLYEKQLANKQLLSFASIGKAQNFLSITLMGVAFYLLLGLTRYYLADIKYTQGENFSKLGDFQNAAKFLVEANNLKYDHVYEDKLSNVLANLAFTASYQKENNLAQKLINSSEDLNKKTLTVSPKNVLYWKTRAKNYYLYYQVRLDKKDLQEAITALTKARSLSPTDPKLPYSLSIFYSLLEDVVKEPVQKADYQKLALQEINSSIELKNNYRDAYFLKGQLLQKVNRRDEARAAFEFILQNLNPNDVEAKKEVEAL